ncbi:MAG TPA: AAA family ATPase [Blastocatellia bacterium]|nr:AAA family ATPase [Blastocatellia bacterium]
MKDLDLPFSFKGSLESFTRDLTGAALQDELEPVRCRDKEIDRVITILIRQSKNNPVLVGEAGVGKTAVVEGLAHRIVSGAVPRALRECRILSLSHIDLIAGTNFRGQFEKRLQAVINDATGDPSVILFIDELHNLIGAGSAIGAPMDAANMLKPALAGGRLRVIGATTEIEYARYIRSDSALERRFQPVHIEEMGRGETLEVLRARRPRLEMHHLITISDEALETATDRSIDYLSDRKQPDRSIDLVDETCARIRIRHDGQTSERVVALKNDRDSLLMAEREAIKEMIALAEAKGTPLERLSRGTFKVLEAMGLGVEKALTGQISPRAPQSIPESVRQLQERDPAGRLARIHCSRLKVEDDLRAALTKEGLVVTSEEIFATAANQS